MTHYHESNRKLPLPLSVGREELAEAEADLHGIRPGIEIAESGVGDVHVAEFEAHVVLRAEDVGAECGLVHKVYGVRSSGNVVVGADDAAG